MSSPIKPPGGPSGPSTPEVGGAEGPTGARESSEAFRQTLDKATASDEASATGAAQSVDAVAHVAEDVRAGQIDVATAIDQLVERAMASRTAEALPPARRTELEAFLRRSLAEDPTLVSLTRDLERGD